ncbi:MAG: SipW-dependent-type signal peptide-containing protein [Patescibacteria group bacterium]|nr:SipW-dependent-type signal peptide-containing protein [Patescibacteria group bacterium]
MTKKIIISLSMIALTIAGVTSATIAYFNDTVTVTGVTIAMGTADLESNHTTDNTDSGYDTNSTDLIDLNLTIPGLYPDFEASGNIWLRNISGSPIDLRPYTRLTAATSLNGDDWSLLKDQIEIKITDLNDGNYSLGWQTLEWWNSELRPISNTTGITVEASSDGVANSHNYTIEARVKSDAGNDIQGKSLTGVTWEIIGEQVQ